MENLAIAIFLYVLLTIFAGNKKKKAPPPGQGIPPAPNSRDTGSSAGGGVGFEIPHLDGAPPVSHGQAQEIPAGTVGDAGGVPERNPWQEYAARTSPVKPVPHAEENAFQEQPLNRPISLNPEAALQAVAFAEVLNRPKAYRYMQRYRK